MKLWPRCRCIRLDRPVRWQRVAGHHSLGAQDSVREARLKRLQPTKPLCSGTAERSISIVARFARHDENREIVLLAYVVSVPVTGARALDVIAWPCCRSVEASQLPCEIPVCAATGRLQHDTVSSS